MSACALQLPTVTAGYAALGPGAFASGRAVAEGAAAALAAALDHPVRIAAAARPAAHAPAVGAVRLGISLAALPGAALLEMDARLASAAVDLLAGGPGEASAGLALTPVEGAALELLALHALDGAAEAAARLGPRLVRAPIPELPGALVVDLELTVGPVRGPARLVLPPAAVTALAGAGPVRAETLQVSLPVSVRSGIAWLAAEDLAALGPGDVALVEPGNDALVLPGGLALLGVLEGERFQVEESRMNEWTGSFPVALSVEVARATVPLAELARLEKGAVLPLHAPRDGRVVLRAGERAVARGQLVEIDGSLGVRIEALEGTP